MFPRYFPYGQIPGVNFLPGGIPLDASTVAQTADLSSLLLASQTSLAAPMPALSAAASPYLGMSSAAQLLPGLPATTAVNPLLAQLGLSPALPLLNPNLLLQQQAAATELTNGETADAHTIVRGPVLYGSGATTSTSQVCLECSRSFVGKPCWRRYYRWLRFPCLHLRFIRVVGTPARISTQLLLHAPALICSNLMLIALTSK